MSGDEFRTLRMRGGLTRAEVARRLGVAWVTIARWEEGRTAKIPSEAATLVYRAGAIGAGVSRGLGV